MNAKEWKEYFCAEDNAMMNEMRLRTKRGLAVDSEVFIKNAEKTLKWSLKCLNPGRPKKEVGQGSIKISIPPQK